MRERQRRREITYALEVNADVDLAWGDAVDADAGALEGGDAGPDDAKGRVRRHRVAGAPAAAVHRSHAADDDDAIVLVIGEWVNGVCVGLRIGFQGGVAVS